MAAFGSVSKAGFVRVGHLTLRPFLPTVARRTTVLEYRPSPGECRSVSGLGHNRCAHRLHPQRLGVEGIARPLRDAVVVDVGIGRRRSATRGSATEGIAGKAASSLHRARVVVEVNVAATRGALQHQSLIIRVILGEESIKGKRLAWTISEDPGHTIS